MPQNNSGAKLPANRTMPHSQEAEDAVIGAFLTDGNIDAIHFIFFRLCCIINFFLINNGVYDNRSFTCLTVTND